MREFFAILFFGKWVLLTPNPVSVEGHLELSLEDPIVAVTSGASVRIDVSNLVSGSSISEIKQSFDSIFPESCVSAVLQGPDGPVALSRTSSLLSNDQTLLSLSSDTGVPTKTEFSRIELTSCVELKDVNIYWANYKK